jgi:predicted O-linked N-acetylglucosamine transferase (SPINDLY family)
MNLKALNEQAMSALQAGDLVRAEASIEALDKARPGHPQVILLRAMLRGRQGRHDEAAAMLQGLLRLRPGHPPILLHLGNALQGLKRFEEAVGCYDAALAAKPDDAETLSNRGNALVALKQFDKALDSHEAALALESGNETFWYNRGIALHEMGRHGDALASYDRALSIRPDFVEALSNKGGSLMDMGQPQQALACFDRVLASNVPMARTFGEACKAALYTCNWERMAELNAEIPARLAGGATDVLCWVLMSYDLPPKMHLSAARDAVVKAMEGEVPAPLWTGTPYKHDRIRIAYLSSDFREHPVGLQIAELLEHHDHARFEIIGISGAGEEDTVRTRLVKAFDQFHDAQRMRVKDIGKLLRELEVDVAVDLSGHTQGNMFPALAARPCPVQATWLGYPGTTGGEYIDYIMGDAVVLPHSLQPFYTETIVHLPNTFMPLDTRREMGPVPSRAEMGLPQKAFVFACFNNSWKITPAVFDIWMRLLSAIPESVLWLRQGNEETLQQQAAMRGVSSDRLLFAPRVPAPVHLARHTLADLFLDTLPYNAHSTAADALLAGLPVLTRLGDGFPGRVGASLLTAAGLPELITHSAEEYEATALALARDPARLRAIREKLVSNRVSAPLFDTARFTRGLEAAYEAMLKEKT